MSFAQGYISETIQHDGLIREYSIYVPASYDGTINFPLLFNLHGGGSTNSVWQASSDMIPIADTADFIHYFSGGSDEDLFGVFGVQEVFGEGVWEVFGPSARAVAVLHGAEREAAGGE